MAALSVLGNWLEDSGWTSAFVQANIAPPGAENSFVKSSPLYSLLTKAYNGYKKTETLEETHKFI